MSDLVFARLRNHSATHLRRRARRGRVERRVGDDRDDARVTAVDRNAAALSNLRSQNPKVVVGIHEIRSQAELAAAQMLPPWLGDSKFHRGHRSASIRKDPEHYRALFPDVPDDLEYVWPSRQLQDDSSR